MVQPRLGFWLSLATAVWVAAISLGGSWLAALLGLAIAAALVAGALNASRAESPKAARRVIGAGVAALAFALGHALFGGDGGVVSLALALGVIYAGAQLSLERLPVAAELPPHRPRGVGLAAAVAADELLLLSWDGNRRIGIPGDPAWVAARLRAAAERNRARGWLEDPERAHPLPPALEKPMLGRETLRGLGDVEHLRFESEFEPFDPEARDAFLAARANRTAHAWLWRHREGPRPTLVCIHSYMGGRVGLDARAFDVRELHHQLGLDVVLYTLPLHGPRALGRRSGKGFLGGDPLWTNAAFGQVVWDLRRLTGWLRSEGTPLLGIQGSSLGGYTTALYASLDARLACAVPRVPSVLLARLVWSELAPERRRALEAAGVTESQLDEAWASHAVLRHRPRVAPEGRLIVAGAADRICPPEHARALHAHWGEPEIHWFAGSHLVAIGRGAVRLRLASFLRQRLLQRPPETELRADLPQQSAETETSADLPPQPLATEPRADPPQAAPPALSRFQRPPPG